MEAEDGQRSGGGGGKHGSGDSFTQPLMFTKAQVVLSASESANAKVNQERNDNHKRTSESGGMNISALQLQSILKRQKRT